MGVELLQVILRQLVQFYMTELRFDMPLDISAVSALHELSHLPVVIDPSHATGKAKMVEPMAMAATAAGTDGLMIEVHNNPACALCDGAQSLTPAQFDILAHRVWKVREAIL